MCGGRKGIRTLLSISSSGVTVRQPRQAAPTTKFCSDGGTRTHIVSRPCVSDMWLNQFIHVTIWVKEDSNLQHPSYGIALHISYSTYAVYAGVEPVPNAVTGRHLSRLTYRLFCRGSAIRTRMKTIQPRFWRPVPCHWGYTPVCTS